MIYHGCKSYSKYHDVQYLNKSQPLKIKGNLNEYETDHSDQYLYQKIDRNSKPIQLYNFKESVLVPWSN